MDDVKTYTCHNDKWLSVESDDKLTERELVLTGQDSDGDADDNKPGKDRSLRNALVT